MQQSKPPQWFFASDEPLGTPGVKTVNPHSIEISLDPSSNPSHPTFKNRRFATTSWSRVVEAENADTDDSRQALEELCLTYWYPLYAFVRRKGYAGEQAADLTQGFFAHLLQNNRLGISDENRGRFRTFLMTSISNYVNDQWRHETAQKRGGDAPRLSIDVVLADQRFRNEPAHELTPEKLFERGWALTVLEQAVEELRSEYVASDKAQLFEVLQPQIGGDEKTAYSELAEQLGISGGAVKVAVFRLRDRYRAKLRDIIAETIDSTSDNLEQDVDDEVRRLFEALS